jgi:4-amino-4-deoxy-L-arabinose transferase-like glycosyltransferase
VPPSPAHSRASILDVALIAAVGALVVLPFLGQTHDVSSHEIRHAEIAREMAESRDFLVPTLLGEPYRDKPPVVSSMIALLFLWKGEPSIALARLPSAAAAIAGAIAVYAIGVTIADRRVAVFAALGVLGTQGYQDMARTARPDMVFTALLLVACLASLRSLLDGRSGGFALAGAAAAGATLLKGPLALSFCALFPYAAMLRPGRFRTPRISDWLLFAIGFTAAAALWVAPVVARDGGAYLRSFLTQPDLTTWHLGDTFARIHWPWMYGLVAFLPLTVVLPRAAIDALRRGIGPALAVALAMLVVLSIIPKKRMHYQLPVLPFLALAVAEASAQDDRRSRLTNATYALVAVSLAAGPLYYGLILPRLHPGEAPELAAAKQVLAAADGAGRVACSGSMAETLAFVARRRDIVQDVRAIGAGGLVVVTDHEFAEITSDLGPRTRLEEVTAAPLERDTVRLYRIKPR